MAYRAKQEFLWYSHKELIREEDLCNCDVWLLDGLVELVKPSLLQECLPKEEEEAEVLDPLDVNEDGRVDAKDVLAVVKKAIKSRKKKK